MAPHSACQVTLPDGSQRTFPMGTSVGAVAASIGPGLARQAVGGRLRVGEGPAVLVDVHHVLPQTCALTLLTAKDPDSLDILRHSAAHILARAVQELFPGVQVAIGPTIEHGFYYDFLRAAGFSPEELTRIDARMREIIHLDEPFRREVLSRASAEALFAGLGEAFKLEILAAIPPEEPLTVYHLGGWLDLCRGPHLPSAGRVSAFSLTHTAGAFWRGDEKRPQLARIYGTAFWSAAALETHLAQREAARQRDHRRLGRDLDLFTFHPVAPAMPFFLPAGAAVYRGLSELIRRYYRALAFEEVITPQLYGRALFERSGHVGNYADNMYFVAGGGGGGGDDDAAALKPMNCPAHALLFGMRPRSWRELPVRMADFGRLHRFERSGTTGGLTRVRSFCQDDAHLFCRQDQIAEEIGEQLAMLREIYALFGFNMRVALAGRPARSLGSEDGLDPATRRAWDARWQRAEDHLAAALAAAGLAHSAQPGEGAFYGPKIDCEVEDALGRWHQLGTIQLDFGLPERFDLTYIDSAGQRARPVMVHRAVLGSVERFIGILVEHTGGDLPMWLAPQQVRVLPLTDAQLPYAREVTRALWAAGLRVRLDARREKLGLKVREAELGRVPASVVVGQREAEARAVTLRWRRGAKEAMISLDQGVRRVLEAAAVPTPSSALADRAVARLDLTSS